MNSLPKDLQVLLHEFAGPWRLETALTTAYDFFAEQFQNDKWKVHISNYDHCCTTGDIELTFGFYFTVDPDTVQIQLTLDHELCDWPGYGCHTAVFDFWSIDEVLEFLPKLGSLLPKGINFCEELVVCVDPEFHYIHYPDCYEIENTDMVSNMPLETVLGWLAGV